MTTKNLFLMCGLPGAGKSTFLKKHAKTENSIIISRDTIRFSLVQPNEEYFSHEDEVTATFWKQINAALAEGKNVFADQTSLTPKARKWFLDHVHGYEKIHIVWIDADLESCLERNENRKGTRAYVPKGVIRRMDNQFVEPTFNEDERIDYIWRYDPEINTLNIKEKEGKHDLSDVRFTS